MPCELALGEREERLREKGKEGGASGRLLATCRVQGRLGKQEVERGRRRHALHGDSLLARGKKTSPKWAWAGEGLVGPEALGGGLGFSFAFFFYFCFLFSFSLICFAPKK